MEIEMLTLRAITHSLALGHCIEPAYHHDVRVALPRIAKTLKQSGGEEWAVGEVVDRIHKLLDRVELSPEEWAAQIWCRPENSEKEMDADLCQSIANALRERERFVPA